MGAMTEPFDWRDPHDDAAYERQRRDKRIGRLVMALGVIGGLILVGPFLLRAALIGLFMLIMMDHAREDQGPAVAKGLSERFSVTVPEPSTRYGAGHERYTPFAGFTDARFRKISGGIDSSGPGWTAAKLPPQRAAALVDVLVGYGMLPADAIEQLAAAAKDAPPWWQPRDTPTLRVFVDRKGGPLVIGQTYGAIFVDPATGDFWMWYYST